MSEEFRNSGTVNFSISAIMAHEFAHLVQFQNRSNLSTKKKELQADYMAGWYVGKGRGWAISETAFREIMAAFFNKGDYDFNNPSHHGTPEERLRAIQEGFENASLSRNAVYRKSNEFVQNSDDSTKESPNPQDISEDDEDALSQEDMSALTQVLRAADHRRIGQLKGSLIYNDPELRKWDSQVKLSSARECAIELAPEDHGLSTFTCRFQFRSEDEATAKQQAVLASAKRLYPNARLREPSAAGRQRTRQSLGAENWTLDGTVETDRSSVTLRVSVINVE